LHPANAIARIISPGKIPATAQARNSSREPENVNQGVIGLCMREDANADWQYSSR
jgi:pyruvoyl-dependent arginine decarboxylase (PvlArgDC)